jgi:chitinase
VPAHSTRRGPCGDHRLRVCRERSDRSATIAADKLTHQLRVREYQGGQVVEGFARDAENFKVLAVSGARIRTSILISVGGWTWSGAFSDARC